MIHETATDIETTGLLPVEDHDHRQPSRTLRVAVSTTAVIATYAFVLRWKQPQINPAAMESLMEADGLPYDCDAGRWNAFQGWSEPKKTWCCTNQQKGCPDDPLVTGVAPGTGAVPIQTPGAVANPNNYNCDAGRWNAHLGWSVGKQTWCCASMQKGCPDDPLATGVRPGVAAAPLQTAAAAPLAAANPNNYNCDAGRWNAHIGWSVGKQTWCCTNQQKGCPDDPLATGVQPGAVATPGFVPGVAAPVIGANPNNYDCDAGRWNANNGWSDGKKAWCCTNQQKGCPGDQVDTGAR